MKSLIFADPHWSTYSSIVRSRGTKYSTRLENLIQTLNWIESEAVINGCDSVVCLGDFFDKSELSSEEITALQEINWANIKHYIIVGNHEMSRSTLEHSSAHLFTLIPNCEVIDSYFVLNETNNTSIVFLPYILDNNRKTLKEYLQKTALNDNVIILSHNDIAGIQMGNFVTKRGFSISEIEDNCNLFINGHLHNCGDIGSKIINIGNITGQNFSEDAFKYEHKAILLDTENKSLTPIVNPYALNFYKLDLSGMFIPDDKDKIQNIICCLHYPAVVTIKCNSSIDAFVRETIENCSNIIECRITLDSFSSSNISSDTSHSNESSLDHIQKFQEYVINNIGNDSIVLDELERVSK